MATGGTHYANTLLNLGLTAVYSGMARCLVWQYAASHRTPEGVPPLLGHHVWEGRHNTKGNLALTLIKT